MEFRVYSFFETLKLEDKKKFKFLLSLCGTLYLLLSSSFINNNNVSLCVVVAKEEEEIDTTKAAAATPSITFIRETLKIKKNELAAEEDIEEAHA